MQSSRYNYSCVYSSIYTHRPLFPKNMPMYVHICQSFKLSTIYLLYPGNCPKISSGIQLNESKFDIDRFTIQEGCECSLYEGIHQQTLFFHKTLGIGTRRMSLHSVHFHFLFRNCHVYNCSMALLTVLLFLFSIYEIHALHNTAGKEVQEITGQLSRRTSNN